MMELSVPARLAVSTAIALTMSVATPPLTTVLRSEQTQTRGVRDFDLRGNLISLRSPTYSSPTVDHPQDVTPDTIKRREGVMNRIARLRMLSEGWLGQGSKAPNPALIVWLEEHADVLARAPYKIAVSPVADGSVALQWMMGDRELTAELRADNEMYLFVDFGDSDEYNEAISTLSAPVLESFILAGALGTAA